MACASTVEGTESSVGVGLGTSSRQPHMQYEIHLKGSLSLVTS